MQGKVAGVHARVPELEARRSELQAELAQLLDRHHALTEVLPWARQLVRASLYPVMCRPVTLPALCRRTLICPYILGSCSQAEENSLYHALGDSR